MVIKFIDGLDSSYDMFKANFLQNRIFVEKAEEDDVTVVSFDVLVRATLTEEKQLRQIDERTAAIAMALVAAPAFASDYATSDPNTRIIPYCAHFQIRGHNLSGCFSEHPEKASTGRRRQTRKRKFRNKSKGASKRVRKQKANTTSAISCARRQSGETPSALSQRQRLLITGRNVHIDERIPLGYVPRDKRKDRSDDDSGESLRESNDESGTSSASANRSIRRCGQNNALLSQSTLPISTSIVNPRGTNTNGGQ